MIRDKKLFESIGIELRALLEEGDISSLAKEVGVSRQTIRDYLLGKYGKKETVQLVYALALERIRKRSKDRLRRATKLEGKMLLLE